MPDSKIVMGIETSCDETAVGIVNEHGNILANQVLSQLKEHEVFGGVVPEIAARAHMDHLDTLIKAALKDASMTLEQLDAIAATSGPGLIGGVMVGMMAGKAIAAAKQKPFIGVNHLEAHLLMPRLTDKIEFPYMALLVSGGHTQILVAEDVGHYKQLGSTIDDALGECFDKSAKMMGLPYPGGPNLEKMAAQCSSDEKARELYPLPLPLKGRKGCDFSFSGLKTAVKTHIDKFPQGALNPNDVAMLACSFEQTICDIMRDRCTNGITRFKEKYAPLSTQGDVPVLVASGGVAANKALRKTLEGLTTDHEMRFIAPPIELCSDNGVMIAWTGLERLKRGLTDKLDIPAKPRWPLDRDAVKQS